MKSFLLIITSLFLLTSCATTNTKKRTTPKKVAQPFSNYESFEKRKVIVSPYALFIYRLTENDILEIKFYAHGNLEAINQIDSKIEYIKYLTQHIRKEYPVEVIFIDGDPTRLVDGRPPGTFQVIKEVYFPKTSQ